MIKDQRLRNINRAFELKLALKIKQAIPANTSSVRVNFLKYMIFLKLYEEEKCYFSLQDPIFFRKFVSQMTPCRPETNLARNSFHPENILPTSTSSTSKASEGTNIDSQDAIRR